MPKFSADNYGDITVKGKKDGTTNNKKATRIRRTTVFARTLRTLSDTQWNNMIVTARTYFLKTNKVSKSRVCAGGMQYFSDHVMFAFPEMEATIPAHPRIQIYVVFAHMLLVTVNDGIHLFRNKGRVWWAGLAGYIFGTSQTSPKRERAGIRGLIYQHQS